MPRGRPRTKDFHLPRHVISYHGAYYYRGPATAWTRKRIGAKLDEALTHYARLQESLPAEKSEPKPLRSERYVYLIGTVGESTPIKIGVAFDVAKRLADLQVSNASALELRARYLFVANRASEIEAATHTRFSAQRLRGEWFNIRARDIAAWLERDFCSEMLAIERHKERDFSHESVFSSRPLDAVQCATL